MKFICADQVNYYKNSFSDRTSYRTPLEEGGYESFSKKTERYVIRSWNKLINVVKEMACIVAYGISVNRPSRSHVSPSASSPSLSQAHTLNYAYSQNVGVLIGNGFNSKEVMHVMNLLQQYGVFIDVISEKLGTVTGADGTKIKVNKTFLTTSPYLLDSLYIVGGIFENQAKFKKDIRDFLNNASKHYKPIGVASTGQSCFKPSEKNNFAGVVFAANNPNFGAEFVSAIAKQRFRGRK